MRLPGFTADQGSSFASKGLKRASSRVRRRSSVHAAQSRVEAMLNRTGSTPIYFPPDFCPPGERPVLVQTGGEKVCLRWVEGPCIFKGTPFEKCWPARCINEQTTAIQYRWECGLLTVAG